MLNTIHQERHLLLCLLRVCLFLKKEMDYQELHAFIMILMKLDGEKLLRQSMKRKEKSYSNFGMEAELVFPSKLEE